MLAAAAFADDVATLSVQGSASLERLPELMRLKIDIPAKGRMSRRLWPSSTRSVMRL